MLNSLWSKTQHNRFHVVIKPGEVFPSEIVDFDFMAKKISQIDAFLDNPGVKSQCRFDDSQDGFYFTSIKQTMCLVCVLEKNTKMHINAPFIKQISQETFDKSARGVK